MEPKVFPVIDLVATGNNIRRLRMERGLSVKDLQRFFGFEEPRAVYKWQKGECLPTVDNLYALGVLLDTPMDSILVGRKTHGPAYKEQQENSCCSVFLAVSAAAGSDPTSAFFVCFVRIVTNHVSDAAGCFRITRIRISAEAEDLEL